MGWLFYFPATFFLPGGLNRMPPPHRVVQVSGKIIAMRTEPSGRRGTDYYMDVRDAATQRVIHFHIPRAVWNDEDVGRPFSATMTRGGLGYLYQ